MTPIRPGQPTPTPRPGTGPQIPAEQAAPLNPKEREAGDDEKLHPQEISREKMESEMPADPDPDDPVSP